MKRENKDREERLRATAAVNFHNVRRGLASEDGFSPTRCRILCPLRRSRCEPSGANCPTISIWLTMTGKRAAMLGYGFAPFRARQTSFSVQQICAFGRCAMLNLRFIAIHTSTSKRRELFLSVTLGSLLSLISISTRRVFPTLRVFCADLGVPGYATPRSLVRSFDFRVLLCFATEPESSHSIA